MGTTRLERISGKLDTIDAYYRFHVDLRAVCACGRAQTLSSFTIKMHVERRGESGRIEDIAARLLCKGCERRGARCEPIERPMTRSDCSLPED